MAGDDVTIGELHRTLVKMDGTLDRIEAEAKKTNGRVNGIEAREGLTAAALRVLEREVETLKDRLDAPPSPPKATEPRDDDAITFRARIPVNAKLLVAVAGAIVLGLVGLIKAGIVRVSL